MLEAWAYQPPTKAGANTKETVIAAETKHTAKIFRKKIAKNPLRGPNEESQHVDNTTEQNTAAKI